MKKVSAVITTHNRLELLKRAIESVKSQTYTNIELIVVCDGSEDGTKEYCESIDDIIFIYIPKEKSKGGNYARNIGIKHSTGDYVALLDDDDYWLPTKIAHQVNGMNITGCKASYCKYNITFCNNIHIPIDDFSNKADYTLKISNETIRVENLKYRSLYKICVLTSSLMVSKEIIAKTGPFDEQLKAWQEFEFIVRLAQQTLFCLVDKPLFYYSINNNNKRISDKLLDWKKSVKYIYYKHSKLYDILNFAERTKMKHQYYLDGYIRSKKSAGRVVRSLYYIRRVFWGCLYKTQKQYGVNFR